MNITGGLRLAQEEGFSIYLMQINRYPLLDREEEYMLAKRVIEYQDKIAAEKLITSHLRLVVKLAFKMQAYKHSLMDLISEGNMGLMRAVKKFNPELGYRFSTYAMLWIKAAIGDFILRSWSLVKIGTTIGQKKLFFTLNKIKKKLRALSTVDEYTSLSIEESKKIAIDTGLSVREVIEMESRMRVGDRSLDEALEPGVVGGNSNRSSGSESSNITLLDTLEERESTLDSIMETKEMDYRRGMLAKALHSLSEREQEIITARHLREDPTTLAILSQIYNVSSERIRQVEAKALEKIRDYCLCSL